MNDKSFSMFEADLRANVIICTVCNHMFIVNENQPCEHLKTLANDCKDWIKNDCSTNTKTGQSLC